MAKCICCKTEELPEIKKEKRMLKRMAHDVPLKDELVTHDGVVFFPEQLLPSDEVSDKNSLVSGIVPQHVINKSKKLNLKLKFKNISKKANPLGFLTHRKATVPMAANRGNFSPIEGKLDVGKAGYGSKIDHYNHVAPQRLTS